MCSAASRVARASAFSRRICTASYGHGKSDGGCLLSKLRNRHLLGGIDWQLIEGSFLIRCILDVPACNTNTEMWPHGSHQLTHGGFAVREVDHVKVISWWFRLGIEAPADASQTNQHDDAHGQPDGQWKKAAR